MREGRNYLSLATAVTALLTLISGCRSSDASPPPTTTAAPTTKPTVAPPTTTTTAPPTTTTIPPTTAPPTTPPPTTAPPTTTPNATPEERLGQRAIQRHTAIEECYAAPTECDIDAILDEYYERGTVARSDIEARFREFIEENWKWTETEKIENAVAEVSISPTDPVAATTVCSKNGAVRVEAATGTVINDQTGYFEYETTWQRTESGKWMVLSVDVYDASPGSDSPCNF